MSSRCALLYTRPNCPLCDEAEEILHTYGYSVQSIDITLDQDKVTARIEELASAYPQKEQIISYYRSNPQMLQQIESAVLEDQALEKISESATIKEVSLSYKEVTGEK